MDWRLFGKSLSKPMQITFPVDTGLASSSGSFLTGYHGHRLLRDWVSSVIHLWREQNTFSVRRDASSPGDFSSWLGSWWWHHPSSDRSRIIVLQTLWVKWVWDPFLSCMKHGVPDPWIVDSSGGDPKGLGGCEGARWISLCNTAYVMGMSSQLPPEGELPRM